MSAVLDRVGEARARNYRDLDDTGAIDWGDPVDAVAVSLRAFTYETSATVASMVDSEHGRGELEATWARLEPVERQRWRRRAATALEIGERAGA